MPANKPHDLGDVHAPVEDIDVPFTLKLLVVIMLIMLIGLGFLIALAISRNPSILNG